MARSQEPQTPPLRRLIDNLRQDVRFGVRSLGRAPGFFAVAAVTLAFGIGANTAIFSVVRGVLLEPLPYVEPDRLVHIAERNQRGGRMQVAGANFRDWREETETLEHLAVHSQAGNATILGGGEPARAPVVAVSEGFFEVFGVQPARGRAPRPEEHREGAEPVAVVSHRFWRDHLGGRPLDDLRLEVSQFALRVVGVMPPAFDYPEGTAVWLPGELYGENPHRTAHNWWAVGRLAPGVSLERAKTEIEGITKRLVAGDEGPADYLAAGVWMDPLRDRLVGDVRRPILVLLGAAALVLLIACTNLASAFLARGTERTRELAVRSSLGATRGRLLTQLFVESLVVALAGAGAGLALAAAAVAALPPLLGGSLPRLSGVEIDGAVLGFTLAVAVATALLFGLLPGLRITGDRAAEGLRSGGRASAGRGWRRSWRLLVAAEVALALVLLVGSGLLIQSLWKILRVELGFEPESVVTVDYALPPTRYPEPGDVIGFHRDLLAELEGAAGVVDAGVLSDLPLSGSGSNGRLGISGGPEPHTDAEYRVATGGAFHALGIPVLRGRVFDERDRADSTHVAVVNRALAERAWPGESPLGKRINSGGMERDFGPDDWATVVGVVGDVRDRSLARPPEPTVYMNALQRPARTATGTLVVRSGGAPEAVAGAARAAVLRVDTDVPTAVASMQRVIWRSVAERRFSASLLGAFAFLALVLSAVGIYGVVAYTVGRRRRELGIRLALGASPADVRRGVVIDSLVPVAAGLAVGTAGAVAASRVLRSLLYEVEPTDSLTFVAVVGVLGLAAFLASWLPARETVRIDPVETLRAE